MKKLIVIASGSFNDRKMFEDKIADYVYDVMFVKTKSVFTDWYKNVATVKFIEDYSSIEINNDDIILIFWDNNSLRTKALIDFYGDRATVIAYTDKTHVSYIEQLDSIKNERWREGCYELMRKLPSYFWAVAASSSGKYHPECDLGYGGLVRHSVMTAIIARDLVRSEIFIEDTELNSDLVTIAALFHDCLKQGLDVACRTVDEHPLIGADFVQENLKDYIEEEYLTMIVNAIRSHMGKWNTSKDDPKLLMPTPKTPLEKLIHTADYMSSRKYIKGIWN